MFLVNWPRGMGKTKMMAEYIAKSKVEIILLVASQSRKRQVVEELIDSHQMNGGVAEMRVFTMQEYVANRRHFNPATQLLIDELDHCLQHLWSHKVEMVSGTFDVISPPTYSCT